MGNAKILVVEDEIVVARDLQRTLESMGYTVTDVAVAGGAALRCVIDERPDLVLMDIGLKGDMDGVQTAELIGKRYDIPVIYLTSHSDAYTVSRARMTKPAGYVLKPYNEDKLQKMVEAALALHRGEQASKADGAEDAPPTPAILVVAAPSVLPEMVRCLGQRRYRIKLASRAATAARMLSATPFDMVLIDLDLPDERGEILVRQLRRDMGLPTAVVVVASETSPETLSLLKSQDIMGLVWREPRYESKLLGVIDRVLEQRQTQPAPVQAEVDQVEDGEGPDEGDHFEGMWEMWQMMSGNEGSQG